MGSLSLAETGAQTARLYQTPAIRKTPLRLLRHDQLGEMLERAVVRPFRVGWKAAAGKLARPEVIAQALTTESLARAGVVAARARLEILRLLAFHKRVP